MKALIIGAGSIGARHLKNLNDLNVKEIAIVEPDPKRSKAVDAKLFPDLASALKFKPDFAVICTPNHLHQNQCQQMAENKIPFFVEKPLGITKDGIQTLIKSVKHNRLVTMVGCNMKFHPGPLHIKKILEEKKLGRIHFARLYAGSYLPDWRNGDYRTTYSAHSEQGGGCLFDYIHEIDLAQWFLSDVQEVYCRAEKLSQLEIDVEDTASLVLKHKNGSVSEIHLDYLQRNYSRGCHIVGEIGTVEWDFTSGKVTWYDSKASQSKVIWQDLKYDLNQMYVQEMQHFIDCLDGKRESIFSVEKAAEVLDVVLAAKRSTELSQTVTLSSLTKRVVAIIQARMGSSRFPEKVLQPIGDKSMLERVVERAKRSRKVDAVIVATSNHSSDDKLEKECAGLGIEIFRGDEMNVLDRFYQCAKKANADVVVRITADCPLIDPEVVDQVIAHYENSKCDYASNILEPSYPDGLDVEVFSFAALEKTWRFAKTPFEKEHVTPFIRMSSQFKLSNYKNNKDYSHLRWTVDYPEDLKFVNQIYQQFGKENFGLSEVLNALSKEEIKQATKTRNEGYYKSLIESSPTGAAKALPQTHTLKLLDRSKKVIPGASQTFSKGHTQHVVGVSPLFLKRGKGSHVWDVDGNEYVDYVQGLLPNILGYSHDEVNQAAVAQLALGHSFSLPCELEIQLAEKLCEIIPSSQMVRFGKNGSDATAGAIRAARAITRRDRVATCGYHGWQDWYIGSTTRNLGVPQAVRELTHGFTYNDPKSLRDLLEKYPKQFAAVILEPFNFTDPKPEFLREIQKAAHDHGALFIFDEICTGFHFGLGGAQKIYGVTPDLACFGKAMGNGFPIACVVGKKEHMKIFDEIFFSFTFGGEAASMAASLKVIEILQTTDALKRMEANGKTLQDGMNSLLKQLKLDEEIVCRGRPQWSLIDFKGTPERALLKRNLFQQEAVKRGVLTLVTHNLTAAHSASDIEQTLCRYASVFKTMAEWLSDKNPARFIEGTPIQPVFKVRS